MKIVNVNFQLSQLPANFLKVQNLPFLRIVPAKIVPKQNNVPMFEPPVEQLPPHVHLGSRQSPALTDAAALLMYSQVDGPRFGPMKSTSTE